MALSGLAESRDDDTGKHLERVQRYCTLLAHMLKAEHGYGARMDKKFIETLSQSSLLHDIGKVAIPDNILLKPGKLDYNEFEIMKTHTTRGAKTLEAVRQHYPNNEFINIGIEIAQSHHERWDGGGYPEGLSGDAIPLSAQILAIADVYDALRSSRCYKEAYSREQSLSIIESLMGSHFAPDAVMAFLSCETEFNNIHEELTK
jgi:putative two-component system response regulator